LQGMPNQSGDYSQYGPYGMMGQGMRIVCRCRLTLWRCAVSCPCGATG
jgi:hypothetical protein